MTKTNSENIDCAEGLEPYPETKRCSQAVGFLSCRLTHMVDPDFELFELVNLVDITSKVAEFRGR
jgi:hypothetical protein